MSFAHKAAAAPSRHPAPSKSSAGEDLNKDEKEPTAERFLESMEWYLLVTEKSAAERFGDFLAHLRSQRREIYKDQFNLLCTNQLMVLDISGQLQFVTKISAKFEAIQKKFAALMVGQTFADATTVAEVSGRLNEIATVLAEKRNFIESIFDIDAPVLSRASSAGLPERKEDIGGEVQSEARVPDEMVRRLLILISDPAHTDLQKFIIAMDELTDRYADSICTFITNDFRNIIPDDQKLATSELNQIVDGYALRIKDQTIAKPLEALVEKTQKRLLAIKHALNQAHAAIQEAAIALREQVSTSATAVAKPILKIKVDTELESEYVHVSSPKPQGTRVLKRMPTPYHSSSATMLSSFSPHSPEEGLLDGLQPLRLVRSDGRSQYSFDGPTSDRGEYKTPAVRHEESKTVHGFSGGAGRMAGSRPTHFGAPAFSLQDDEDEELQRVLAASLTIK